MTIAIAAMILVAYVAFCAGLLVGFAWSERQHEQTERP